MNDFQVLQSLKENQRYRKLRTIILTDSDELDQAVKGLELGAVDYIRKPLQKELLKSRIEVHAALLRAGQAPEQQLEVPPLTFDMLLIKHLSELQSHIALIQKTLTRTW